MASASREPTASLSSRCLGIVSGFVVKLAREATGTTQEELAETLGVDASTLQGWESGRRPLTAMRTGDLVRLRMQLIKHGAPATVTKHLSNALDADLILATGVDAAGSWDKRAMHPLAASVHRRSLVNLVTWPITGRIPAELTNFRRTGTSRRSAATYPWLYPAERGRLFDHLRTIAEHAVGADTALLRRQAIYLLGFDQRAETASWLRQEWHRATRHPPSTLQSLLEARSAAIARASLGDPDGLECFVGSLCTDRAETANLNYWSHWIGELPDEQHDDTFMVDIDPRSWGGLRLADHLASRIAADSPQLSLNLHTLHSLVGSRASLLDDQARLRGKLSTCLEELYSARTLNRHMRDQLAGLNYAVRLANR